MYFVRRFLIIYLGLGLFFDKPFLADYQIQDIRPQQYLEIEAEWCLSSKECLGLEVADTLMEKKIGLMNRDSLQIGKGMLFKFSPSEIVGFWMKDTLIPLDMVFFFENSVIALETNVQPCNVSSCSIYGPNQVVDGVIELAAGEVERLKIKVGDHVDIKYQD